MAKSFEELKSLTDQIKNETNDGANTAARVGGAMSDIVDKVEETSGNIVGRKNAYGEMFNHESNSVGTSGVNNHAEGQGTTCNGSCNHAEGRNTQAFGVGSHSEGDGTVAGGNASHSEGMGTATAVVAGHVEGKYNAATDSIHIVGGGTSEEDRKNLHEIKSDGSQYMIGVGGYDGTNMDDSKSVQESLTELENKMNNIYLEQVSAYGIEFDTTVSSPTCTRIGNMELHRKLPIQNNMRGCLLDDNGNVTEYLPDNDWSNSTLDGSNGQVMIEIPRHWRKCETEGTKRRVLISETELAGYKEIPKMYISAYEATVQRSTNKLCSVKNTDVDYRGGNNNAENDGTYKSFLGLPATSISRTNFRTYARNRNTETKNWNCYFYEAHKTLFWLFVIEYATLNSQLVYNAELTSEGYHQGGLGNGVTALDWSKWSTFNGNYPIISCGYTDSLGNGTGVIDYTMPTEYDTTTTKIVSVPRYRGIENPFGHIWKWTDGINVRISPDDPNGDGLSKVFVTDNPEYLNDSNYDNMQYIGNEARTESYVKEIIFGEDGEIIPSVVGGGSTTYFCDYHYTNIPASSEALRGVLFGGGADRGASAGLAFAHSISAPSAASTNFGSRLCFLPE